MSFDRVILSIWDKDESVELPRLPKIIHQKLNNEKVRRQKIQQTSQYSCRKKIMVLRIWKTFSRHAGAAMILYRKQLNLKLIKSLRKFKEKAEVQEEDVNKKLKDVENIMHQTSQIHKRVLPKLKDSTEIFNLNCNSVWFWWNILK